MPKKAKATNQMDDFSFSFKIIVFYKNNIKVFINLTFLGIRSAD